MGKPVQFRLGLVPVAACWNRLDLGIRIGELDLDGGLLLKALAIHIDGFEDAPR